MKHVQHEADALPDRDEADHDRKNDRQQADDLIEHALQHRTSDDGVQGGGGSGSVLNQNPLSSKIKAICSVRFGLWLRVLGFEPGAAGSEPAVLPLHQPAIYVSRPGIYLSSL